MFTVIVSAVNKFDICLPMAISFRIVPPREHFLMGLVSLHRVFIYRYIMAKPGHFDSQRTDDFAQAATSLHNDASRRPFLSDLPWRSRGAMPARCLTNGCKSRRPRPGESIPSLIFVCCANCEKKEENKIA